MQIIHVDDTNEDAVEIRATLDAEETAFLIEFAINNLLAMGASPFMQVETNEGSTAH